MYERSDSIYLTIRPLRCKVDDHRRRIQLPVILYRLIWSGSFIGAEFIASVCEINANISCNYHLRNFE